MASNFKHYHQSGSRNQRKNSTIFPDKMLLGKDFITKLRYVWTSGLVIDGEDFPSEESNIKFSNFVDQVLTLHDGQIYRIYLVMEVQRSETMHKWILMASIKKIQHIKLER